MKSDDPIPRTDYHAGLDFIDERNLCRPQRSRRVALEEDIGSYELPFTRESQEKLREGSNYQKLRSEAESGDWRPEDPRHAQAEKIRLMIDCGITQIFDPVEREMISLRSIAQERYFAAGIAFQKLYGSGSKNQ